MNSTTDLEDSPSFSVHLLDVGKQMYGDSILCQFGSRTILIDGGHSSDFKGQKGFTSIPKQIEMLVGHPPPFSVNLLIVTHCHSDHIGCLPQMVQEGMLTAEWALVADEKLGFGRSLDGTPTEADAPDAPASLKKLVAALREEDRSAIRDDQELEAFLEDAATLEDRYSHMLKTLADNGTKLRRYGREAIDDLLNEFRDFGMQVLGPERDHLLICAEAIAQFTRDAAETVSDIVTDQESTNDAALYRYLMRRTVSDAVDRPGKGAALNDQSIVLLFQPRDRKILLTGDMQFAVPEVNGLESFTSALRDKIKSFAPFDLVKLAHHASYNGFDEGVLEEMGDETPNFAMSGGIDAGHPDPGVLALLKTNAKRLTFARTDRNGQISFRLAENREEQMEISRGRLNDFTRNTGDQTNLPLPQPPLSTLPMTTLERIPAAAPESQAEAIPSSFVDVTTRVPHVKTRVTITIDVQPQLEPLTRTTTTRRTTLPVLPAPPDRSRALPELKIAGGRTLTNLLFVTSRDGLRKNIGISEADHVLQALQSQGQNVFDQLPNSVDASQAVASVRSYLTKDTMGVVLLGGLDIIPSQKLDVLDETLRASLAPFTGDADNFIVWNDEIFGDKDGDGLPEIPVSRIPDGKSPEVVFAAVQARPSPQISTRFGVRNRARPFAEGVFGSLPGTAQLLRSEPTTSQQVRTGSIATDCIYLMLHGADYDGTRFWGEDDSGTVEAFNAANVPQIFSGVVLAGCCWGALTAEFPAAKVPQNQPVGIRTPAGSIALSFLKAGALAFIGCTGTHYSPTVPPYNYFGGPMQGAFRDAYLNGAPPAEALFKARIEYLRDMPHGRPTPEERAIEMKTLRQFTCLGLGW